MYNDDEDTRSPQLKHIYWAQNIKHIICVQSLSSVYTYIYTTTRYHIYMYFRMGMLLSNFKFTCMLLKSMPNPSSEWITV